ncbi:MAG: tyrosine-type recombinase/integrase [Actinomycetota bacterium]
MALKAGFHPDTRLHDVRHAVATELGRRGVHPVIVSAVLGHTSPAFTIAVYQHAWQEGPAEAARALETALRPSRALAIRWHGRGWGDPQPGDSSQSLSSGEWGGEDSNLRPADYESYGVRAALSVWCCLVLPSPGQRALLVPFVLSCVVLCRSVR